METGQIIHMVLSVAAFVIALRALFDVRSLRKQLSNQKGVRRDGE